MTWSDEDVSESVASRRRMPTWAEFVVILVAVLVAMALVKTFVIQPFAIPSGSMENTLQIGDRVLVSRSDYRFSAVQRGDIVVFDGSGIFTRTVPEGPGGVQGALHWLGESLGLADPPGRIFVKRVIGLPGDTVQCCDGSGRITVNGVPIDEQSYLYPGDRPSELAFSVAVPPGAVWVMGDHRSVSADSRAHLGDPGGGMVPVDRILGRAVAVAWPLSRIGGLSRMEY